MGMIMFYINVYITITHMYLHLILSRENRYLLFLTENYAALEILKQYLTDQEGSQQPLSMEATLKPWEMEPFVLFGSSFPRDKEYTQVNITP